MATNLDVRNRSFSDSDDDFPTIEQILNSTLRTKDFITEDSGPDNAVQEVEVALGERGDFADRSRSASGDDSDRISDDPIILLGDNDSCAFEAEVEADDVGLCTESVVPNSSVTADDSTALAPTLSDRWLDIDDFLETPRLQPTEQGASTSNFTCSYNPPPRFSSEPLGDIVGAIDLHKHRARSEAAAPYAARPQSLLLHCARALPETQFSEDGHLNTSRDVTDENGLVDPARNVDSIDKRERKHQEANSMAPMQVSTLELSPATTHEKARCDNQSDDELNDTESAEDRNEPYLLKRKRLSSCSNGQTHKKRKYHLPQKSAGRSKPRSKFYQRTAKLHPVRDQVSRVAMGFSTDGRLPSPALSVPQDIYSEVLSDRSDLDGSSQNI